MKRFRRDDGRSDAAAIWVFAVPPSYKNIRSPHLTSDGGNQAASHQSTRDQESDQLNALSSDTKCSIAHACASRRLGVTTREARWLLSQGESRIRRLVRRGPLVHAVAPTLINVASLRVCFPDDELRPLREAALDALLDGRLRVPAPPTRYARPAPITNVARYLTTTPLEHPNCRCSISTPK